jgi:adenylosuccinate synthase
MINGATDLIMMKADVMDDFDTIKICTGYKINGQITTDFPYELNEKVEPVYIELPGWKSSLTQIFSENEFPEKLRSYIKFIEEKTGVPITIISVGPNREQTIIRKK